MSTKPGKLGVQIPERAKQLGELCNNPLNIMGKDNWQAKRGVFTNSAGSYVVFGEKDSIPGWVWGYRAAFVDWNSKLKVDKDGRLTVSELIYKWAPPNVHDNHTDAYVKKVCEVTRLKPNSTINLNDRDQCIQVAKAMTMVENARCIYDEEDIGWGWDLAHGVKPKKSVFTNPKVLATGTAVAAGAAGDNIDAEFIEKAAEVVTNNTASIEAAAQSTGIFQYILFAVAGITIVYALYTLYKDSKGEK